ncbi:MAG: fatty acyl-AMP ligase [Holophagales bacterium]|nr:fatty acyl-AMP ligase [Holophagales bacterium]
MNGPRLPIPKHRTVNEALAASAASDAGLTFVDLAERETFIPYGEIHARARRTAGALRARGVETGDRVALVFPTSPGFVDAFFGVLLAGAVPVPLYPPVRLGRLAEYHVATSRMIIAVRARLVLADAATRKLLGQAIESSRPPLGCLTPEELGEGGAHEAVIGSGAFGLIQFSSGSTASPRPVALSHESLLAQLAALRFLLPAEEGAPQKGVSWLPLYHDMGLIGCLLQAVFYPAPLVLIPPELFLARPALWLRAIARHRATISVAPSFAYALCGRRVRDEELAGADLSSWRLALCGAEPVSPDSLEHFARRFEPFGFDRRTLRPVYGLAEASLAVTFTPGGREVKALRVDPVRLAATGEAVDGTRAIASVGAPVPGTDVEVRTPDGRVAGERRVGRIFVRGPSVMTGYFGLPEITRTVLTRGWLDTGDLGFVAGGELYVCGREKNVIVIRGANHLPHEFEECLAGVQGVRAGCAVAVGFVPEGEDGEQLLVLTERARDGGKVDGDASAADRIRGAILAHTGIRPHTVRLLAPGTIPRTSSGKLRRNEALRRFLAGELNPPARVTRLRIFVEVVRSALAFARARRGMGAARQAGGAVS